MTNYVSESDKYSAIRSRFLDSFYFQGRVASHIRPGLNGDEITFGDQTIYMGQALLALSAEMAVTNSSGNDRSDAHALIGELLIGIEELERKANERYGGEQYTHGLFVRDDIVGPEDSRLDGRFRAVNSDWQNPELENDSPSGDQIFGLLNGLYGVVRFSSDDTLANKARMISSRLFEYARKTFFILRLPSGSATKRGSDVRWLSSLLHGLNKAITGEDRFDESFIKIGDVPLPLNGVAAFWDSHTTPELVAQLTGEEINIPIMDIRVALNSFALHILLMALSPTEVWTQTELERVASRANHHLSAIIYAYLHGASPQYFDVENIDIILDACPIEGPHSGLSSQSGWQHDNRWVRCTNIFEPNDGQDAHNGLDWLLLYNFRQLVFETL